MASTALASTAPSIAEQLSIGGRQRRRQQGVLLAAKHLPLIIECKPSTHLISTCGGRRWSRRSFVPPSSCPARAVKAAAAVAAAAAARGSAAEAEGAVAGGRSSDTKAAGTSAAVLAMREVVELEAELEDTYRRAQASGARTARLLDASERLEKAMLDVARKGDGATAERVRRERARVLAVLRRSEERTAVLHMLAASLCQAIRIKERRIRDAVAAQKKEQKQLLLLQQQQQQLRQKKQQKQQRWWWQGQPVVEKRVASKQGAATGASAAEAAAVERKGVAAPAAVAGSLGTTAAGAGTTAMAEQQPQLQASEVAAAAAAAAESSIRSTKGGDERRKAVLALFRLEVQELVEEVERKLALMRLVMQSQGNGSGGGGGSGDAYLQTKREVEEAEALLQRLAALRGSIDERLLSAK